MKIKAAVVYEKGGSFSLEELDMSEPRDDEVVVRIVGVGICHTDLACRDQHLPAPLPGVFGHEGAGIVEKIGSRITQVHPGDHVVLSYGSCKVCDACKSGQNSYCSELLRYNFGGCRPDGSVTLAKGDLPIHGSFFGQSSFANFALASEANVVKVNKEVPLEILGPMGCGVQTGAGAVINSLKAKPGDSLAVFGTGTVGISAILGAMVCGCTTIIAVDLNDQRLDLARVMGATHTINASNTDPVAAIQEITGGGAHLTLECVGNPKVLRQAVDSLALRGVCGLVGAVAPNTEVNLNMDLIMNGRTVRGIIEGDAIPDLFIPKLIALYQQKRFAFDRLIKFYPLSEINQAVADMEKGLVIKPILRP
jgi:aryl-alcohol dehydrogenase